MDTQVHFRSMMYQTWWCLFQNIGDRINLGDDYSLVCSQFATEHPPFLPIAIFQYWWIFGYSSLNRIFGYSDGYFSILMDIQRKTYWRMPSKHFPSSTFGTKDSSHSGFLSASCGLRGLCQLRQFRNSSSVKISRSHTQSAHQRWVLVCFSVWVSSHLTGAKRREWMGLLGVAMGVAGIVINSDYGSFPHSLRLAPVSHL